MNTILIDKWSAIVAASTLLFSWLLFWSYTGKPMGSFIAAAIAAGMAF